MSIDDTGDLPDTDDVLIINRASHKEVVFTLPAQLEDLYEWLESSYDRRTSPADFARAQGWITYATPSAVRLWWARFREWLS